MGIAGDLAGFAAEKMNRNYVGATLATNNMTVPSTESNRFFHMDFAAGVQILNLPATAGLPDGFSVVVYATGIPSGYATARVSCETGKVVSYRGVSSQHFYMIGFGEIFRFTWLAGSGFGFWIAECLVQPARVQIGMHHSTAAYNGSQTSWSLIPFSYTSGHQAPFNFSNGGVYLPVIGNYQHHYRIYGYGSNGTAGTIAAAACSDAGEISTTYGYDIISLSVGEGSMSSITWQALGKTNDLSRGWYIASNVNIYNFMSNAHASVALISR